MSGIHRSLLEASRRSLALLSLVLIIASGGCKRSCVPVSGKVTYEDGSLIPADQIRVVFMSPATADPKDHRLKGTALADGKTGTFESATTLLPRDGILPGEHKVLIECILDGQRCLDLVPPEYCDPTKTPLTVQSSESPFQLKVRKPGSNSP